MTPPLTPPTAPPVASPPRRRGAAAAMIILLIASLQLIAVAGLGGGADDADQAVRRLLAVRVLYASDAAGLITARQIRDGLTVPPAGTVWTIGASTAEVVSAPPTLTPGEIVIDARSDTATRRITIDVDLEVP